VGLVARPGALPAPEWFRAGPGERRAAWAKAVSLRSGARGDAPRMESGAEPRDGVGVRGGATVSGRGGVGD